MIRKAFLMSVVSGAEAEYERRHNPVWPELQAAFAVHGVRNFSIYLDEATGLLFSYLEVESEELWETLGEEGVAQRWMESLTPLFGTEPDGSVTSRSLREVFHID